MKVIAGLGNPGVEYADTRHNAGFMVLEGLASAYQIPVNQAKFKAEIGKGKIEGEEIILTKPQTYMNRSGESVSSLLSFFKLMPADCIVVCDDLELPVGKIRIRAKGGHGGHNGLRSIIEQIGNDEFIRVRVGIGRPSDPSLVSSYVLGRFGKEEQPLFKDALLRAEKAIISIIKDGPEVSMNRFNG